MFTLPHLPIGVLREKDGTLSEINPDEKVVVATWNILHTEVEYYEERLEEIVGHMDDVDVLLIQEALFRDDMNMTVDIANRLDMHIAITGSTKTYHAEPEKGVSGLAILSRLPILSTETILLEHGFVEEAISAWVRMPSGREMLVISSHLEWGGPKTYVRARQAKEINSFVLKELKDKPYRSGDAPVVVWGGDFNAVPDSLPIQYITGKMPVDNNGTFWIDAWETSGDGSEGYTNVASTVWAKETALNVGIIHPEVIPPRRIDYIFLYDWAYGRPGYPMNTEIRGNKSLYGDTLGSDHFAVVTELWDPPTDVYIRPLRTTVRDNLQKD